MRITPFRSGATGRPLATAQGGPIQLSRPAGCTAERHAPLYERALPTPSKAGDRRQVAGLQAGCKSHSRGMRSAIPAATPHQPPKLDGRAMADPTIPELAKQLA